MCDVGVVVVGVFVVVHVATRHALLLPAMLMLSVLVSLSLVLLDCRRSIVVLDGVGADVVGVLFCC